MWDFTIEQLAILNNIVDDEIFRKSSRTGYESYLEDLEKLLVDIENAYKAKKANIEETRKIAADVDKALELEEKLRTKQQHQ